MAHLADNKVTMGKSVRMDFADTDRDLAPATAQDTGPDAAPEPREDEIRAALDRVLASPDLASSPRLSAFLRFVVETTLDGRAEEIKGYTIAVEALGRAPSFDPQTDPIVRVEATRLRRALEHFYAAAGADESLRILIPRGSYVPSFERREGAAGDTGAGLPETGADHPGGAPTASLADPRGAAHAATRRGGRALWAVGAVAVALMAGVVTFGLEWGRPASRAPQAAAEAEGVLLPVVEVEHFVPGGARPLGDGVLRAMEERLRDAFAQFDFVEVKEAGAMAGAKPVCTGPHARPLYTLAALAEGHADGTFSVLFRLADQCAGVIVWSRAIEGLKSGEALADSEQSMVRQVAGALMEAHGVVPVHARAQVRATAPQSAFGCMAQAFALLARENSDPPAKVRACLEDLTRKAPDFAMAHALTAVALLEEAMREDAYNPTPARAAQMLKEAERAVDLAPESAYAAQTLALVQSFLGEYRAALDSGGQALRLNPFDADVAAAVGTVYIASGRVAEGEALLSSAQAEGAARVPLKDAYLAMAAFLEGNETLAQSLLPQLKLHPSRENALALALVLYTLNRTDSAREAVMALITHNTGGAEAVRRMVRHLLPAPGLAERAIAALETSGLSQRTSAAAKVPRG